MSADSVVGAAAAQQLRQACAELEQRLRAGQPCTTEELLAAFPALAAHTEAALELIYTEHVLREELGQRPSPADWPTRFPQWRADLEQLFQVHRCARLTSSIEPAGSLTRSTDGSEPLLGSDRGARQLGNYELLQEIGRGGMGVVYKARQIGLNRLVALKMILAGSHAGVQDRARFRIEAEAVARLQHPNIVQVHEIDEQEGRPYLTLEFVAGGSLENKLAGTPLPIRQASELLAALALAVQYAHQHGVLHRDLKPANVLLTDEGIPKIADFGLAKCLEGAPGAAAPGAATETGAILGTPNYMAPEQARGQTKEIGPAADVYALGAILYECLTGRPPFQAAIAFDTLDLVRSHEPVPPRRLQPKVPRDLENICLKCLQKEPMQRYASAQALADDLRRFLDGRPVLARPVGVAWQAWRWCRRNPSLAAASGVAAAALTAVTVVAILFGLSEWHNSDLLGKANQEVQEKAEVATAKGTLAQQRLRETQREAANVAFLQGVTLCEQGESGRGLHWLARSLQRASEAEDFDFERAIRLGLTGWCSQVPPLRTMMHHESSVRAVAFSPDGQTYLTATADMQVRVWAAGTRQPRILSLEERGPLGAVAFSPDGRTIVTVRTTDPTARLWEVSSGRSLGLPLQHPGAVTAVAFSPDSKTLLTGCADETARLWDADTCLPLGEPMKQPKGISAVAFSPDGKTLLVGSYDGAVRRWDRATGKTVGQPLQQQTIPWAVAFSPDGKTIVAGGGDGATRLWNAASGNQSWVLWKHRRAVTALAFSPDGKSVLTGSFDHTARWWEMATAKLLGPPLLHGEPVSAVTFSPDGQTILTGSMDKEARLWEVAPNDLLGTPLRHQSAVLSGAFSPDGQTVLTGSNDGTARLWNTRTRRPFGPPLQHQGAVVSVAFSPDGQTLVTNSLDGTVRWWKADTGQPQRQGRTPSPFVKGGLAFAADGRTILTACQDGTIRRWDPDSATPRDIPLQGANKVWRAAFSPDGRALLTAGDDHLVRRWDTRTGQALGQPFPQGEAENVWALAFSPDARAILTGGEEGTVRRWEIATGKPLGQSLQHQDIVKALAFSPDGTTVMTGSSDLTARFWDVATGRPLGPSLQHQGEIMTVAFSPDGRTTLTCSTDLTARLWTVPVPVEGDPESVLLGTRLLTGMELDDQGMVRALDAEAWEAGSKQLETKGGSPIASKPSQRAWHEYEANAAERTGRWFSARWHLDRLLAADPDNAALRTRRARVGAALGE